MIKKNLERIIQENKDSGFFTGGVDEQIISDIEEELGVTLPQSYKWFLLNYGSGGVFGVNILGVGKANRPISAIATKEKRKFGLNKELVIIEDCDEYYYCLDTGKLIDSECPVISWDQFEEIDSIEANNFYEFFYNRLIDSKEAWEEDT
jgi:hypothetical protein